MLKVCFSIVKFNYYFNFLRGGGAAKLNIYVNFCNCQKMEMKLQGKKKDEIIGSYCFLIKDVLLYCVGSEKFPISVQ